MTNSNILSLPLNENATAPVLPSAEVSISAPAFEANSDLEFLDSISNDKEPVCKSMFGTSINLASCWDALSQIPEDTAPRSFGDRKNHYNVQLPRRYSSADGKCVIDIFLKIGVIYDYANDQQILRAARSVVIQCVQYSNNYVGGYMSGVGNSGNLVVIVSKYTPAVRCYGSIGSFRTASQGLLDMIPTDYYDKTFGSRGMSNVEVILPVTYLPPQTQAARTRFYIRVVTLMDVAVTARWIDLWMAAVAINTICVGIGRAGFANIGGGLRVKIDRTYVPPGPHGLDGLGIGTSNATSGVATA